MKAGMKKYLSVFVVLLAMSCGKPNLAPRDYVGWVGDKKNGLIVSRETQAYRFSLQYKPLDYVIMLREKNERISRDSVQQMQKELSGMQYFTFSIEPLGVSPAATEDAGDWELYLSGMLQDDLKLVDGGDTLSCLLYQYEPAYGVNPAEKILLGFRTVKAAGDKPNSKTLILHNRLDDSGDLSLVISAEAISQIPNLKLND